MKLVSVKNRSGYSDGTEAAGAKEAYVDGSKGGSWWIRKFDAAGTEVPQWHRTVVKDSTSEGVSLITSDSKGNILVLIEGEGFIPFFIRHLIRVLGAVSI